MKILVVDDEEINIKLLKRIFELKKHSVVGALRGEAALKVLEQEEIDMVFLDYNLPGMSGIDVLKKIRKSKKFGSIPVILITGMDDGKYKEDGLKAGADDYIIKPIDIKDLLSKINALGKKVRDASTKYEKVD